MNAERQLDPEALGDHIDRLYRAAWSLCGSREEAEDLVQATFEHVLRKPRFLRSEDDVGYLLRVLRNTFFSQRRTAARRPQTTPLPDDLDLIEDRSASQPDARLESARAVRRDLAAPRRLPRRAGRDRRGRALLPRGGEGAKGPRGDDHDAASPRPSARRRALVVESSDPPEDLATPPALCSSDGRDAGRPTARRCRRRGAR